MNKSKEIKIEKVKIDKLNFWFQIIGSFIALIAGVIILILTDSSNRLQIVGWVLIGYVGFKILGGIDYSKIKKKKKGRKKINKKTVDKFAKNFIFIMIGSHILNIGFFFLLMYSKLSNLMIILIYFPLVIGLTTLVFSIGFWILLHRNHYSLHKIIKKFKKKK